MENYPVVMATFAAIYALLALGLNLVGAISVAGRPSCP